MPQYPETKLDRAVGRAIDEVNRDFLNDPEAQEQARALGTLYRRVFDGQALGFKQYVNDNGYPLETLEDFCQRSGT